jgi:methylated-DNA-[protein]-cysteine S-methyltransferase
MEYFRQISSPFGTITMAASDAGLTSITLGPQKDNRSDLNFKHVILDAAEEQLTQYFEKKRTTFDLPLCLQGTEFQKQVWNILREIPYGQTISYGEQAKQLGNPKASRAVGGANGKNPLPIVIPCHRVIGKDGSLTGFSGGMEWKKALLEWERPL